MILPASYSNGFAPRDGQPLYPELWNGCVFAWAPCLGPTGETLRDWSGFSNHTTWQNAAAASLWSIRYGRYHVTPDGNDDVAEFATVGLASASKVSMHFAFSRTVVSAFGPFAGVGVARSEANRLAIQPWNDGVIYLSIGQGIYGYFSSNDLLSHSLVVVFDGNQSTNASRMRVWMDGTERSLLFLGTIPATIGTPVIGRFGRTINAFENIGAGSVETFAIWNRVLQPNEAIQLSLRPSCLHELAPRRRSSSAVQFNRRRRLLLGASN